ncbi:MAG: GDP-mannose 4,6-dehydratase [Gaiellaceae bacterium]
MSRRRALIVGIGGQDGSYLAEFLLARDYEVYGLVRHSTAQAPERIAHLAGRVALLRGDLVDQLSLNAAIDSARPHEVYNFGGTSFVPESWQQPGLTAELTGLGVVRLLESIRLADPTIRFYQASTSEMFGRPAAAPQTEATPFDPQNPYAVAKVFGHQMVERYRDGFGLFAVSGILYNHESPRRGVEFVTRKITHAVARIALGLEHEVLLGDLSASRDWGFAGDYIRAMWLMLQQDEASSYVVATGELHSVQDVAEVAFARAGLDWRDHVRVDERFVRPKDATAHLVGDAARARDDLDWHPSVDFEQLIHLMVDADLARTDGERGHDPEMDWPASEIPQWSDGARRPR